MSEDGAPPGQLSEKGWVHAHGDRHFWIPCPAGFPAGHNRDSWAAMMAEAWWEQSGLTYPATAVAALAAMLRRIHEQLYAKVPCHQIWIYLRDPAVPPLPVTIGSWKCRASGPRGCAFSAAPTIRPAPARPISQSSRPETSERASGLWQYRMRQGKAIAVAGYAFRAEELETDVQISTATGDLRQLGLDLGGIEEFIRGITVVTPGAPE